MGAEDADALLYDDDEDLKKGAAVDGPPYPHPNCCPFLPFDIYPWIMLASICFLTFGSYWVFDFPGAVPTELCNWFTAHGVAFPLWKNGFLYSVYSYPNVILGFFGGYIVDRFTGVRLGAFLFCFLVFCGQLIFCFGIQFQYYWAGCVLGRFVFGLGGESLTVAQNTFTARWFSSRQLALAFGITVSFSRIGSAMNFIVTPRIADIGSVADPNATCSGVVPVHLPEDPHVNSIPYAAWFGLLMCCISITACCVACFLDWYGRAKVKVDPNADTTPPSITHIRYFPLPAFNIMLMCTMFYIAVLTFNTVASSIIQHTGPKKYTETQASTFLSIPNFVAIVMSPTFGFILDRVGRSQQAMFIASCGMVCAHVMFLGNALEWWFINPTPIMIWIGVFYSMGAGSLWPSLALVVPAKLLGTAYGAMTSLQNLGLALGPGIIGVIQSLDGVKGTPRQYSLPIVLFILCVMSSALLSLLNMYLDNKLTQGRLSCSRAQRALLPPLEQCITLPKALLVGDEEETPEGSDATGTETAMALQDDGVTVVPVKISARSMRQIRRSYMRTVGIPFDPNSDLMSPPQRSATIGTYSSINQ